MNHDYRPLRMVFLFGLPEGPTQITGVMVTAKTAPFTLGRGPQKVPQEAPERLGCRAGNNFFLQTRSVNK